MVGRERERMRWGDKEIKREKIIAIPYFFKFNKEQSFITVLRSAPYA